MVTQKKKGGEITPDVLREEFIEKKRQEFPTATLKDLMDMWRLECERVRIAGLTKRKVKAIKNDESKKRTHRLIQLGGLMAKAGNTPPEGKTLDPTKGLLAMDDATILGVLLTVQAQLYEANAEKLLQFKKIGASVFAADKQKRSKRNNS